jgi:hypothetical protein
MICHPERSESCPELVEGDLLFQAALAPMKTSVVFIQVFSDFLLRKAETSTLKL